MKHIDRRQFISTVGRGALLASLGPALIRDLGYSTCHADETSHKLLFGELENLVSMIQETPIDRFLPTIVQEYRRGTASTKLIAATALANARCFGGEDYVGYHSLMALAPAYHLANLSTPHEDLLPVLKVMYRNAEQIQKEGGNKDTLEPVTPAESHRPTAEELRELVRQREVAKAEDCFARMATGNLEQVFNDLQPMIEDDTNVHRVVLVWRAWEMLPFAGKENAHTLLRQSVRFCLDEESQRIGRNRPEPAIRAAMVKLIDQHKLMDCQPGNRRADDAWIAKMALTVQTSTNEEAANAVAQALVEGFSPADLSEAISLAANRLLLCDPGRTPQYSGPGLPPGSVHGASVGVHASDAANAWRNIARVCQPRTSILSLVVAAHHTGGQHHGHTELHHTAEDHQTVTAIPVEKLLVETDAAVRNKDQRRVAALVDRYGQAGLDPETMFGLLRQFAISEDGVLHAEKYFQTAYEEFHATRPSLRWGHLVALARVSASEYGTPARGIEEAAKLIA
jgi:hypothetical protein